MDEWKPLILLVEDNIEVVQINERLLNRRGYETLTAGTIAEARTIIQYRTPDLAILDIMLPDGNGLEFCAELRMQSDVPVLFLTGKTAPRDKVNGLEIGGDYYLTKPYEYDEFLACVKTLLRREQRMRKRQAELSVITRGPLTLEIQKMKAHINGRDIGLTHKEFAILLALIQNEGKELSGDQLYEIVWGTSPNNDARVIRTHVSNLRSKLDADNNPSFALSNEYGKGYCFILVK